MNDFKIISGAWLEFFWRRFIFISTKLTKTNYIFEIHTEFSCNIGDSKPIFRRNQFQASTLLKGSKTQRLAHSDAVLERFPYAVRQYRQVSTVHNQKLPDLEAFRPFQTQNKACRVWSLSLQLIIYSAEISLNDAQIWCSIQ